MEGIEPLGAGSVALVFSADANYAPYLSAALASLSSVAAQSTRYDVIVLATGIDEEARGKLLASLMGAKNISLRFFDVEERVRRQAGDFFVNAHITPATYYRLFTPSIFERYDRILYLDGDIIILDDVAALYSQDLKGAAAGVMRDFFAVRDLPRPNAASWARQLAMRDTGGYFNAGVLLFDLAKLRAGNFEQKWFDRLRAVKTPRLHDQDILNHCLEGRVTHLDPAWNSLAWIESLGEKIQPGEISPALYEEYLASVESPKILHFSSRHKPWDLPHLALAGRFWQCAANTPYYHNLIFNTVRRLSAENDIMKGRLRFPPLALKYFFYNLMGRLLPRAGGARFRAKAYRIKQMNPGLRSLLKSWH